MFNVHPGFILVIVYFVLPALAGFIMGFLERNKPTLAEMVPVLVTALFWLVGTVCGLQAILGKGDGKGLIAISAAAFTMSLTTYGEMFNSAPGDTEESKQVKAKIKSRMTVFRALLIFVLTAAFFYTQAWSAQ